MRADWSRDILHQSGVLYQHASPRGGAVCVEVRGDTLFLAPTSKHGGQNREGLEAARAAWFEVITPGGIWRIAGTFGGMREIEINGVTQQVAALDVQPEAVELINRRAHHRVSVTLKGAFAALEPDELVRIRTEGVGSAAAASYLESLAEAIAQRSRPCTVRDLGLGGARLATSAPAPSRGAHYLFDLALGRGQQLRNLLARIIESRPLAGTSPTQFEVRISFEGLSRPAEAQLSRYLTRQQLELLRRGVRA
jgi:hypothetical protein